MKKLFFLLAGTASLLAVPNLAHAGVVFTINSTDKQTGESLSSTEVLVEGTLLKMSFLESGTGRTGADRATSAETTMISGMSVPDITGTSANGGGSTGHKQDTSVRTDAIFNSTGDGKLIFINHGDRTYWKASDRPVGVTIDPTSEILKNAPPEKREQLAGMMNELFKTRKPPNTDQGHRVVNTGKTIRRNGRTVTVFEKYEGDTLTDRIYGVRAGSLRGGRTMMDAIRAYSTFLKKRGLMKLDDSDLAEFDFLSALDDFLPVGGQSFEGGQVDEEWDVESITERGLDPDAFEPPAGYRLRTMGGFFQ